MSSVGAEEIDEAADEGDDERAEERDEGVEQLEPIFIGAMVELHF